MGNSSSVEPVDLEHIRHALQAAKTREGGGVGRDAVVMTLAVLYNDLEDAMEAGVTQAEVLAILAKHGLAMPRTRFAKHMYFLRQVVERRKPPEAQPDMTKASLISADLKDSQDGLASTDVGRLRRPQIKPKRKPDQVAAPDKVLAVAQALVGLAQPNAAPEKLAKQLRIALGPGWTIKTAVQFGQGPNYASWMQAHWPDPHQRDLVVHGRHVADHIARAMALSAGKSLPDVDQMLRMAQSTASSEGKRKGPGSPGLKG